MAKFLDQAKIDYTIPKLVETKNGYIFNGTFYDKRTLIAESLEDLASCGGTKSLSLNRVASYPVITGTTPSASPYTAFRGDAVIQDEYEQDVYYALTFDYEKELNNGYKFITKYKDSQEGRIKLATAKFSTNEGAYFYGYLVQYLGQSETELYFVADISYIGTSNSQYQWNKGRIVIINKDTLQVKFVQKATVDRTSYSKIIETEGMIYLLCRKSNDALTILEFEKETHVTRAIKSLPAYTGELDRLHFCAPAEMTSKTEGYIIDMPAINNNNFLRWIDFSLEEFSPALDKNGYPRIQNLKSEDEYILNGYSCYNNYSTCPVFDKDNANSVTQADSSTFYWDTTARYLDVTFTQEVNIWRSGVRDRANSTYSNPFIIKQWDDDTETWSDITSTISQTVSAINNSTWEKTISNLPAGRYRFEVESGKLRMDSCWYVEAINSEEYLTKRSLGFPDGSYITYNDIQFTVECDSSLLNGLNSAGSWRVVGDAFFTEANGMKFINFANQGLSTTNWGNDFDKSHITTFKINETNKELALTGQCQLSNAPEISKALAINSKANRVIGMSGSNTFILDFDSTLGHFVPIKYFAYASWSCGFDMNDNVWILNKNMELVKFNDAIPERIEIAFEDNNLEYTGNDINTNVIIESFNFLGDRLASKIALEIKGNAAFDDSGSNEIIVNTINSDAITVPITINGSGVIVIYPALILDIKED